MSGKHTPGPWQVVDGCDVFTPLGAINADGVQAAHNDGWHIADCGGFYTSTAEGECQLEFREANANARLIAAAPELLDALIDIEERLEDGHWAFTKKHLRALIAKATGEAA